MVSFKKLLLLPLVFGVTANCQAGWFSNLQDKVKSGASYAKSYVADSMTKENLKYWAEPTILTLLCFGMYIAREVEAPIIENESVIDEIQRRYIAWGAMPLGEAFKELAKDYNNWPIILKKTFTTLFVHDDIWHIRSNTISLFTAYYFNHQIGKRGSLLKPYFGIGMLTGLLAAIYSKPDALSGAGSSNAVLGVGVYSFYHMLKNEPWAKALTFKLLYDLRRDLTSHEWCFTSAVAYIAAEELYNFYKKRQETFSRS